MLRKMFALVEPITPEQGCQAAEAQTAQTRAAEGRQAADLHAIRRYCPLLVDESEPRWQADDDIEVIYSGDKSKARIVGRFAPKANPEYKFDGSGEMELITVIATDVLAEGLNLQDCDKIINYDLHWNPVRLIQRFGRIDRIGSEHDVVYGFNFLPETGHRTKSGTAAKGSQSHSGNSRHHWRRLGDPRPHRTTERRGDVRHLRKERWRQT